MSLFLSARGMFVCDYNDNDRSSYRIFIGFEFQIQSNRSWRSERQIICAFRIEFPFSRMLFGLLWIKLRQKTNTRNCYRHHHHCHRLRCVLGLGLETAHTHSTPNWIMISQMPFIFSPFKNPAQVNQFKRVEKEMEGVEKCGNDSEI